MSTTSYEDVHANEAATNTAAAVIAGIEIAGAVPVGTSERFHTQVVPAGAKVEHIDLEALEEKLAQHPRRKTGTVRVQDADSFARYIEKHRIPATEVWADEARRKLVGVINAHGESVPDNDVAGTAGHGDHRVELELIASPSWKVWTDSDKKWLSQQDFAEHLEDHAADIDTPDPATMLEIAESFQATLSTDFKSVQRLTNGQVQLRYEETQGASAGHAGDLEIPTRFTLLLAPFVGAAPVEVEARFRYRIRQGNLHLSYALLNTDAISRDAFLRHVEIVRDAVACPVYQGRPE